MLIAASKTQVGIRSVNKYGRAINGVQQTATDIWDRADGGTGKQDTWTAPTAARVHQIVSTDVDDDSTPTGTGDGCLTLRVYGLTSWDSAEVSEDITMNGTTNVATSNSYVIIHRMEALTWGASGPNIGTITATADTDNTITAQIEAGAGQTQMAIYGFPSTHAVYVRSYYASMLRQSSAAWVNISLLLNPIPDTELTAFITKHTQGLVSVGSNYMQHKFEPYAEFTGPGILKLSALASADDIDVNAGFDLILRTL
jgi:hypothetical protein